MDTEIRKVTSRRSRGARVGKHVALALALIAGLIGAALVVPKLAIPRAKAASSTIVFRSMDRSAGVTFHQTSADGNIETIVAIRVSDTAYHAKTDIQPIQYITFDAWQQDLTTGDYRFQIASVATNPDDMGMGGTVAVQIDKNLRTATVTAQLRGYDMVSQQEGIPVAVSLTWTADGQATHVSQEFRTQTPYYTNIEHLRGKGFEATVSAVSITVGGVDYSTVPLALASIYSTIDAYTSMQRR